VIQSIEISPIETISSFSYTSKARRYESPNELITLKDICGAVVDNLLNNLTFLYASTTPALQYCEREKKLLPCAPASQSIGSVGTKGKRVLYRTLSSSLSSNESINTRNSPCGSREFIMKYPFLIESILRYIYLTTGDDR
jgi:hypothetical protein